ncbi:hypothetical protein GCM10027516_09540 [Niabella aquatica]
MEGWSGMYKGRMVFFINGKPVPPLMYSGTEQGRQTWKDPTKKSIAQFSSIGYDIIQTDMWFKYSLMPDGRFDMAGVKKQLSGILQINPNAKIVVRINVSAPGWWLDKYPAQRCCVTKPGPDNKEFGGTVAESLASEAYRSFAESKLKLFLRELIKLPESDRIVGFHVGGGVYGEWHYYGIFNEPDCSSSMDTYFRNFAEQKYGTIDSINFYWKSSYKSLEEIHVPGYERRFQVADGEFRDPQADQYVIDYYECQQKAISSLVYTLTKSVKENWPRRAITGVFFGYFYGGFTVGAQASQADIKTILESPYIDYLAGPYYSRTMDGSGCYRSLAASMVLNKKIWFTEHDGGTHLGGSGAGKAYFPGIPANEDQTIARMRRNFMYSITENGGQWWYDFGPKSQGGGWWSTPRLQQEAQALLKISNRQLEAGYHSTADVLVVHDMYAYYYTRPKRAEKYTASLVEKMADALLGTGVSFEKIFLMDLKKVNLEKYKVVIFSHTSLLDADMRKYIKTKVMNDGRTVVFISATGYTDGKTNDTAFMTALTGIKIKMAPAARRMSMELNGKTEEVRTDGILSLFQVDDKTADTSATYDNGLVAAGFKKMRNHTVGYIGAPLGDNAELYKMIFNRANVRAYVGNAVPKDYISVGGGIVGIYTVNGGTKTIYALNGKEVKINMHPYSCRYFDLANGNALDTED